VQGGFACYLFRMSGLDDLLRAAREAQAERPHVPLALATLCMVEGSSYRQPGARLLVDVEGRVLAGAVSGGCLEGDVAAHAAAVCERGAPKRLTYDLREDLESIWGFGAMCDGVAHLLLEPLAEPSWLASACTIREARTGGALVTVVEESERGGTRLLPLCDEIVQRAVKPLIDVATQLHRPHGDSVLLDDHHVHCLIDPLTPPISLIAIGAGRGAEAFACIAGTLGWRVTVIDHRSAVLESLSLPKWVTRRCARTSDGLAQITRDERTAVALLTHQFAIDLEWLTALLPLPLPYVGVLGSRQRAAQLLDAVRDGGLQVSPQMERRLHAPIGLDLGGETPESIALASIAEIEAVMHGRPGGALRDRHSPIHARTPTPTPSS